MPELVKSEHPEKESAPDEVEKLGHSLDEWRARIDELLVQVDLAGLEGRDVVRKYVDLTENAYLAARSQFSDVRRDAATNVNTLCEGTDKLIQDLQRVYESAEAALRRGRGTE